MSSHIIRPAIEKLYSSKEVPAKQKPSVAAPSSVSSKPSSSSNSSSSAKKKHRKKKCMPKIIVRGQWTPEEDERLRRLVGSYGAQRWTELAQHFEGRRVGKQCRERWHNHLNPELRTADWTPAEEACVYAGWKHYGPQWAKIANHLRGRSDNRVKNHWNCHVKKFLSRASDKYDAEYERRLQQIAHQYNFQHYFADGEQIPAHMLGVLSPIRQPVPNATSAPPPPPPSMANNNLAPPNAEFHQHQNHQSMNNYDYTRRSSTITPVDGGRCSTRGGGANNFRSDSATACDENKNNRRSASSVGTITHQQQASTDSFDNFTTPTKHCRPNIAAATDGVVVLRSSTTNNTGSSTALQRRLIPPTRLPTDASASLQFHQQTQTPDMYEKYSRLQLRPGNYTFSPAQALQSPPKKRFTASLLRTEHATSFVPKQQQEQQPNTLTLEMAPPPPTQQHAVDDAAIEHHHFSALEASKRQLFFESTGGGAGGEKKNTTQNFTTYLDDLLIRDSPMSALHADIALAMELVGGSTSSMSDRPDGGGGQVRDDAGRGGGGASSSTYFAPNDEERRLDSRQQSRPTFATPQLAQHHTSRDGGGPTANDLLQFYGHSSSCTASPPPTILHTSIAAAAAKMECPTPTTALSDNFCSMTTLGGRPLSSLTAAAAASSLESSMHQPHFYEHQYGEPVYMHATSFHRPTSTTAVSTLPSFLTFSSDMKADENSHHHHLITLPPSPEKLLQQETLALSSMYYNNNNNNDNNNNSSLIQPHQSMTTTTVASPTFDDFLQYHHAVQQRTPDKAQLWAAVAHAAATGLTPRKLPVVASSVAAKRVNAVGDAEERAEAEASTSHVAKNVVKRLRFS